MTRVPGPGARDIERIGARERLSGYDGARHEMGIAPFVGLLAIGVFLLGIAVSWKQATEPVPATNLIEAGIASLTEIDLVVDEYHEDLQRLAAANTSEPIVVPGYPLEVTLSREEAATLTTDELRETLLARSSALVYRDGLHAFDRTGAQSLDRFSSQGLLEMVVGQLSESSHQRASMAVWIFAAATALAALIVVLRDEGLMRVRNAGLGVLIGAMAGVAAMFFARWAAGTIGGDDAFSSELHRTSHTLFTLPLRNFAVLGFLGVFLVALGPMLGLLGRVVPAFAIQPQPEYDYGYEHAYAYDAYDAEDDYEDDDEYGDYDEGGEDAEG